MILQDTKYHKGDIVVIRADLNQEDNYFMQSGPLNSSNEYSSDIATNDMCELRGQKITIDYLSSGLFGGKKYRAKGRWWTDEMFEGLANDNECYCDSLL